MAPSFGWMQATATLILHSAHNQSRSLGHTVKDEISKHKAAYHKKRVLNRTHLLRTTTPAIIIRATYCSQSTWLLVSLYLFLYPCRGYIDFSQKFATQWRRPHKVYIFLISMTRRVDLAMSVCPSVSTQTSLSVLKLSGWNFSKSLISFAGST